MRSHIDLLGWLHCLWGAFGLLTGGSLALLAMGAHVALGEGGVGPDGDHSPEWLLGAAGAALVVTGAAMAVSGRGLLRGAPWSRRVVLFLALPNLILVPFGTALGIYSIWTLLNDDARRTFGRPTRVPVPAGES